MTVGDCSYQWYWAPLVQPSKEVPACSGVRRLMSLPAQVLLGRKYNEKADIFALGMIMLELFSSNLRLLQVCVQRNHQKTIFKHAHKTARGARPTIPKYATIAC